MVTVIGVKKGDEILLVGDKEETVYVVTETTTPTKLTARASFHFDFLVKPLLGEGSQGKAIKLLRFTEEGRLWTRK